MITWSDYYRFAAQEVEAIGTNENTGSSHPYVLTVYLKSGNKFSVSYADEASRRAAMGELVRQIDREKNQIENEIRNKLYLVLDSVNRIDKRQLRIWRQLRNLLGIQMEGNENEPS